MTHVGNWWWTPHFIITYASYKLLNMVRFLWPIRYMLLLLFLLCVYFRRFYSLYLPRCMNCTQRGLATRKLSVCLSVCPSVKRVICDKTKERSVHISIPYERSFSLVSWKKNGWWGAIPPTWNLGPNWPRWSEIADFQSTFARSASTVTPSKEVQLTLIGSPLRAFQWA